MQPRPAAHRRAPGEPDTRQRIQQVALELFTANGYEATSLREIAERLGVTKAALYYHFKTKDDIIASMTADRVAMIDELIEWASGQPRTVETRREAVRRYATMLREHDYQGLMRFFERNHASMNQHKTGVNMRERMGQLLDVLTERDAPLTEQIRCSLAIFALHSSMFTTARDPQVTDEQRQQAALEVALELVERRDPEAHAADLVSGALEAALSETARRDPAASRGQGLAQDHRDAPASR